MKARYLRVSLIALGVVFVIAGVVNGGFNDTLNKAIRICLECIGIG